MRFLKLLITVLIAVSLVSCSTPKKQRAAKYAVVGASVTTFFASIAHSSSSTWLYPALGSAAIGASIVLLPAVAEKASDRLKNAGATVVHVGDVYRAILPSDKLFYLNTHRLLHDPDPMLEQVVYLVQGVPDAVITIAGFSDEIGDARYRKKLSYEQAQSVAAYLWMKGVDRKRFRIIGYGKSRPIASNRNPLGSAFNRRIEVSFRIPDPSRVKDRATEASDDSYRELRRF